MTKTVNDEVLEFLRSFISGGVNQDFKPWARELYQKLYCSVEPTALQCIGCDRGWRKTMDGFDGPYHVTPTGTVVSCSAMNRPTEPSAPRDHKPDCPFNNGWPCDCGALNQQAEPTRERGTCQHVQYRDGEPSGDACGEHSPEKCALPRGHEGNHRTRSGLLEWRVEHPNRTAEPR